MLAVSLKGLRYRQFPKQGELLKANDGFRAVLGLVYNAVKR